MKRFLQLGCLLLLVASFTALHAQSISATLTGVVSDASDAVVPGAKITLKNVGSGDVRRTVTNNDGYFTFASVPVGGYQVTVEASGFRTFEQNEMNFSGAEKRNLNVVLEVGTTGEKIQVASGID